MPIDIHDYMRVYSPYPLHCYVIENTDRPAGQSLEKIESLVRPTCSNGSFLIFFSHAKEFFYRLTDARRDDLHSIDVRFSYVYMDNGYVDDEGYASGSGTSNGMAIFNRQAKDGSFDCFIISLLPLPDHVATGFFHDDIEYKFFLNKEVAGGRAHKDGIELVSDRNLGIETKLYTIKKVEK